MTKYVRVKLFIPIFILFFIFIFMFEKSDGYINSNKQECIIINEVMYDPILDDNYYEWIELYNPTNQSINLSGWTITDNYSEDFLEGDIDHGNGTTILHPQGYAIITDHGTCFYNNYTIPEHAIRLYVDDNNIGNGLSNTKDKLILKNKDGMIIDAIEWGEDYPDVPGKPFHLLDKNHTLSRYHLQDTDNTSFDFYDEPNPTPGCKNYNIPYSQPTVSCDLYPHYIAKIPKNKEYGIPFMIRIVLTNFTNFSTIQLKAYVVGNTSNKYPATQVYLHDVWHYSYYYQNITLNNQERYTHYLPIRFNKNYQEYQKCIKNNTTAYLVIKVKAESSIYEHIQPVYLLDMDNTTANGIPGGYIIGIAQNDTTLFENMLVCVTKNSDTCVALYRTENNYIDDMLVPEKGYYKIPAPLGRNYTLQFLSDAISILHEKTNITVEPGEYNVELSSSIAYYQILRKKNLTVSINITNSGAFHDVYLLHIKDITQDWTATYTFLQVSVEQNSTYQVLLNIIPSIRREFSKGSITLEATSFTDPGTTASLQLIVDVLAPDLSIPTIKCLDVNNKENYTYGQGESITIKAFVKNQGNINTTNVTVYFYYDQQDKEHFLGQRFYDSIGKYQKYPSIEWDTHKVHAGKHTILVVVDEDNRIDEFNESNNINTIEIILYTTLLSREKNILITEVYYHAHPRLQNEFITIYNPTPEDIDISGWYLTNTPQKSYQKQTKILFPQNTKISAQSNLVVTQKATDYHFETGKLPDFEYMNDSLSEIPQILQPKTFILGNAGEAIALKNRWNHTIDVVLYGEINLTISGWDGPTINPSGAGVILKRNFEHNKPCDTNTSLDWMHPRIYGIGQSDFPLLSYRINASVIPFISPDCSYQAICSELRNATKSIVLNMYEFTNPFLGDELVLALHRNVSVRIFMEGSPVGGVDTQQKILLQNLYRNGADIRFLVQDPKKDVYARYTYNHAKYVIIDDSIVIVESCNYVKTGIPPNPSSGNREWGIIIKNTTIADCFLSVFYDDWNPKRCDSYPFEDMNFSYPSNSILDTSVPTGRYVPCFSSKTYTSNFTVTPVFSPDTSEGALCSLIDSAQKTIYIEQLYIYKDWNGMLSPLIQRLIHKAQDGVEVKIILNYNPSYARTNDQYVKLKVFLEHYGIRIRFFYTNWSIFTNVHNKGMIVDNTTVLISSMNWNENSIRKNREAGVIIENEDVAKYYAEVFFHDWNVNHQKNLYQKNFLNQEQQDDGDGFAMTGTKIKQTSDGEHESGTEYKNTFSIVCIVIFTTIIIINDWRKRSWK